MSRCRDSAFCRVSTTHGREGLFRLARELRHCPCDHRRRRDPSVPLRPNGGFMRPRSSSTTSPAVAIVSPPPCEHGVPSVTWRGGGRRSPNVVLDHFPTRLSLTSLPARLRGR